MFYLTSSTRLSGDGCYGCLWVVEHLALSALSFFLVFQFSGCWSFRWIDVGFLLCTVFFMKTLTASPAASPASAWVRLSGPGAGGLMCRGRAGGTGVWAAGRGLARALRMGLRKAWRMGPGRAAGVGLPGGWARGLRRARRRVTSWVLPPCGPSWGFA